ncbi:XYLOGLUCAN ENDOTRANSGLUCOSYLASE/HYDROLASE PROTEIN 8-RELATED [Salix viminalis]|uniref:Xyloglucan endotransglucosylase/hydrolase n=1 Tax=Salix viminalis TaxID=40686 RepID=A0A9Q0NRY9_SALVM|nr:XYLOGLUCAN ENDOTRANSGLUCOSYLASE/HYDROLASE PROTEIN 8-RELATED [Salix viminalis]
MAVAASGSFYQDFDLTWGDRRAKIFNGGQLLSLSLDKVSGSGFQSKKEYLFGRIDMQLKLVAGNSAGTDQHMTRSTSSSWETSVATLIFCTLTCSLRGRETESSSSISGSTPQETSTLTPSSGNLSTSSSWWTIFPSGCSKNAESIGVPFPKSQPMRIYSSLWNADDWATRGGLVKTDWTKAPFTAYYRNFRASACTWSYGASSCGSHSSSAFSDGAWTTSELDAPGRRRLRWVQKYFMIYNYCTDLKRFPQGPPPECK